MHRTDPDDFIAEVKSHHFIEATILERIVDATNKAHDPIVWAAPPEGWDAGEEESIEAGNLADIEHIVFNLDYVHLELASGRWIRLVMGEGWDMIADYHGKLEELLEPINSWVEKQN